MSSTRPLSGITVIEIGHRVAAPYAGMILGELGAEVIKVENPKGGDACRGWGTSFTEGTATAFHAFNRAKRGITIDLTEPTPLAVWAARLDAAGIPNGPIQTLDKVAADAQTEALGIIQQSQSISLVGLPLSFDGVRPPLAKLVPHLGEDNPEIVGPPA